MWTNAGQLEITMGFNMRTKEDVKKQIDALGDFYEFYTKKEIDELPNVLREQENIKAITSGTFKGNTWLIVCTDQRLIFLDKGLIFGLQQLDMPLDKINSVNCKTGLLLASISIWDSSGEAKIQNVQKAYAKKFSDKVIDTLHEYKEQFKPKNGGTVTTLDVASQLEKLAELKSRGILSENEFVEQKKKLLAA